MNPGRGLHDRFVGRVVEGQEGVGEGSSGIDDALGLG